MEFHITDIIDLNPIKNVIKKSPKKSLTNLFLLDKQ